ncbi:endoglucanase 4-like isoform X3 [Homarus americanus]|uniref:endoglucanase 4-like isoform X3 n=1 Tax=Homarus americanus TaxID=6706 RepID=UPI001C464AD6|nr:endoglucanase 4-like isoform X3 [Homarus americanus]
MAGVLVKTCLLGALTLTFLQPGAAVTQCENIVIDNEWDTGYQADFKQISPVDLDGNTGLTIQWTFSAPVDSIDYYQGSVIKNDDYHFTLQNNNVYVKEGEELSFSFNIHYSHEKPIIYSETMNGVPICNGTAPTDQPVVTTTEVVVTTTEAVVTTTMPVVTTAVPVVTTTVPVVTTTVPVVTTTVPVFTTTEAVVTTTVPVVTTTEAVVTTTVPVVTTTVPVVTTTETLVTTTEDVVTTTVPVVTTTEPVYSTATPENNPCEATGMKPYDYSQVLCMSYLFYEAQRSGPLPSDMRITWRGNSGLDDGSDNNVNLTGGYYIAGDHVKFGFPMAFTATMLAWGIIDFADGHETAGQTEYGEAALKWATDYFLKAHTDEYEFYGQVGLSDLDHAYWGRPEEMTMERPSYKIDEAHPGTELAAETAAALAAASMVFWKHNPPYAAHLLDVAMQLYHLADFHRLDYDISIPDAQNFYPSSNGFGDELCWAALWLARATGDPSYIFKARDHWDEFNFLEGESDMFSWDDKIPGIFSLFWMLDNSSEYPDALRNYLDWLKTTASYTPEGLVFLGDKGSNRYAANAAFISLFAAKNGMDTEANQKWAREQMGQLLGDNSRYSRSFVVGYGQNPPQRPHHRSSSCPNPPADCSGALDNSGPNPHVLFGALAAGPAENGDYTDDRKDITHNGVSCTYNAAFTGALAALVEIS